MTSQRRRQPKRIRIFGVLWFSPSRMFSSIAHRMDGSWLTGTLQESIGMRAHTVARVSGLGIYCACDLVDSDSARSKMAFSAQRRPSPWCMWGMWRCKNFSGNPLGVSTKPLRLCGLAHVIDGLWIRIKRAPALCLISSLYSIPISRFSSSS